MSAAFEMMKLTFLELWSRWVTVGLFVASSLVWILLSFTLNLDIVEGSLTGVRILGQDAGVPRERVETASGEAVQQFVTLNMFVSQIQSFVAGVAYWAAAFLGLFAAAPLLPGMLSRGQSDLLFSKPVPRLALLGGHLLGVFLVVLTLATYLYGMIWLVMILKTDLVAGRMYGSILVVVVMFMAMYSVVALLSVTTESSALSLIVTYGLIIASVSFLFRDTLELQINRPWRGVYVGLYHVLPNFAETTKIAVGFAGEDPIGSWYPLISTCLFALVMYVAAAWRLSVRDL